MNQQLIIWIVQMINIAYIFRIALSRKFIVVLIKVIIKCFTLQLGDLIKKGCVHSKAWYTIIYCINCY